MVAWGEKKSQTVVTEVSRRGLGSGESVTPTLKSHGVRILSGGMRTGGGGDDWLSREMPKLSLI